MSIPISFNLFKARVKEILASANLDTISAKQVRKQIQSEFNVDLTSIKQDFDSKTIELYHQVAASKVKEEPPVTVKKEP